MISSRTYGDLTILPTDTTIVLGSRQFCLVWLLVVALRTGTMVLLFMMSVYLNWLRQDGNFQRQYRREIRAANPPAIFRILLCLLVAFAAQTYELVRILQASWHEKRLVFRRVNDQLAAFKTKTQRLHQKMTWIRGIQVRFRHGWLYKGFMVFWRVIGIRSKWFDELFTAREVAELVVQTLQVAQVSALNPSSAANVGFITVLLLNSVSTVLLENVFFVQRRRKLFSGVFIMKIRLALLVTDACLDFLYCIVIPSVIAVYYISHIEFATMEFDLTYHDRWRATMFRQQQQISISTNADVASTVVFHFGILYCLIKVQSIVDRRDQVIGYLSAQESACSVGPVVPVGENAIRLPRKMALNNTLQMPQLFSYNHAVASKHPLVSAILHIFPFLYAIVGIISVSAFVYARYGAFHDAQGCKLYTYPWFTAQASCTVMEINCYEQQVSGAAQEMQQVLDQVNMNWAHTLIFSHCPALVIPTGIRSIPRLFTIEIYNSTLVDWPVAASPTNEFNPGLTEFRFLAMNFTDGVLPAGLLTKDLTNSLTDVFTVQTNLKTLPADLHESWRDVISLCMENGVLTEIPIGIGKMTSLSWVSLIGNQITSIPSLLLDELNLHYLLLSGNPIKHLPDTLPESVFEESCSLALEGSELTLLPTWFQQYLERIIDQPSSLLCESSLYGSRLCTNRVTRGLMQNSTDLSSIKWLMTRCDADLKDQIRWRGFDVISKNRIP